MAKQKDDAGATVTISEAAHKRLKSLRKRQRQHEESIEAIKEELKTEKAQLEEVVAAIGQEIDSIDQPTLPFPATPATDTEAS